MLTLGGCTLIRSVSSCVFESGPELICVVQTESLYNVTADAKKNEFARFLALPAHVAVYDKVKVGKKELRAVRLLSWLHLVC